MVAGVLAAQPPVCADQTDVRLEALFATLRSTDDVGLSRASERRIWEIWLESGDPEVDRMVAAGIDDMSAGRVESAISRFARVIERAPAYAEGWNKRATAHYLNDELEASVADIRRTLALEPRHFGAISGMGLIFLERGDLRGALEAFRAVLTIHPHAPGARRRVEILERELGERGA